MIHRRALLAGAAALPATPALAQTGLTLRLDDAPAPGLKRELLIQWGDRVAFDAPPFAPNAPDLTAAEAQFGWDTRVVAALASPRGGKHRRLPWAFRAGAYTLRQGHCPEQITCSWQI